MLPEMAALRGGRSTDSYNEDIHKTYASSLSILEVLESCIFTKSLLDMTFLFFLLINSINIA